MRKWSEFTKCKYGRLQTSSVLFANRHGDSGCWSRVTDEHFIKTERKKTTADRDVMELLLPTFHRSRDRHEFVTQILVENREL